MAELSEVPCALDIICLKRDRSINRWVLTHEVTGQFALLPALQQDRVWSGPFADEHGSMYVASTEGDKSEWVEHLFAWDAFRRNDGVLFVLNGADALELQAWQQLHQAILWEIPMSITDQMAKLKVYVFHHCWAGARCWFDMHGMFSIINRDNTWK